MNPVGFMNLKSRRHKFGSHQQEGTIYLFLFYYYYYFFKKVLFRVISLDEIIKGVRVDREEDQQLGSETLGS